MRAKEFTEDINRRGFLGGLGSMAVGVDASAKARHIDQNKPAHNRVQSNPVPWQEIDEYLKSLKLTKAQRVGLLNNINKESGFDPAAYSPNDVNGPSGGLFQHHDNKKAHLYRFSNMTKKVPDWRTNWKGQINFALSEPEGKEYRRIQFDDAEAATHYWTAYFEVPADAEGEASSRAKTSKKFS